ncbi:MAG: SDR family oxidoreductase [Bacteroidia bacterium]|nr:SDR family oxidoreductase [Bacteroidia bacterium]
MEIKNSVMWITGASSGIGEALVYESLKQGAQKIIISARRLKELERVKAACGKDADKIEISTLDLSQTEKVQELADFWVEKLGRIDILVNNGGISQRSKAADTSLEVDRRIMEVNYFGQIALTKAVLPHMIRQAGGHIVAVSSVSGKFGFHLRSAYAASKHALHGFFESVYLEYYKEKVRTTLVNPGRVHTQISVNSLTGDGSKHGEMDPGQAKGMPADVCARHILKAVRKEKPEINLVWPDVFLVYLKRYVPFLFRKMALKVSPK